MMIFKLSLPVALIVVAMVGCGGSGSEPQPPAVDTHPPGDVSDSGPGSEPTSPAFASDPLHAYQWHLKNTGQSAFSSEGGAPGIDLNVESLFASGVHGQGVKVLVLDDGIDIRHPDLAANVDAGRLFNFDPGAADAADPTPTKPGDAHGTAVAGIIAAVAQNGIGGRGVAPGASLGGANLLDCGPRCTAEDPKVMIEAYGGAPFSAGAWVINASYGEERSAPSDADIDVSGAPLAGLAGLRGGKGALMLKSAGNEFESFVIDQPGGGSADSGQCHPANQHGLTCQNASFDLENVMPQVAVVASVNARGVKSSYSTAGSNVLISGLGGEYGSAVPLSPAKAGPAIVTTDLAGCARGNSRVGLEAGVYANDFDQPGMAVNAEWNPQCDYTAAMNGTSAAAPTVTGVVALMLGVNPDLTWRDIRHILMRTARRVDAAQAPVVLDLNGHDYIAEPGWVRNAAGLWFSNWYGFGLVDAVAAVNAAREATTHLSGEMGSSGWIDDLPGDTLAIPVADAAGLTRTLAAGARTIEMVQLRLALSGDASLGDLGIELISPSGTRSVLMNAHNAFQKTTVATQLTLASNAFNEESAQGVWTLRIVDVNGRGDAARQARLDHWSLRILGR